MTIVDRFGSALRDSGPAIGAAVSLVSIFVAVLGVPLAVVAAIGLTDAQASSWILAAYALPGLVTVALVARYRQPLLFTGNLFILIFISRLGQDLLWAELVGAGIVAGVVVTIMGPLGLTTRVARVLPTPIVFGLLAGAVLPLVVALFAALGTAPLLVGTGLVAWMAARRLTEPRIPAILVAMGAVVLVAGISGSHGPAPSTFVLPTLELTTPSFTVAAVVSVAPVMVALITLQANIPSLVFLRSEGFHPPRATLDAVSGMGTTLGSLLGPMGVSLSLPATALCAGPDAGRKEVRHRAAAIAGAASVLIGLGAGMAPEVLVWIPPVVLTTVVGLAVVGVLTVSIQRATAGPLVLGPLVALAVAMSGLELLGLGEFFWALVLGLATSFVLEREGWRAATTPDPATPGHEDAARATS
ncbi:MAG TPA: benzoate/H(+) symporter BenE family transporter [Nitriliruptoraceae bacterium]|nr:benzoate/H(+) symporter BenE family transporter [Nitriliruptoraceae bacterium]